MVCARFFKHVCPPSPQVLKSSFGLGSTKNIFNIRNIKISMSDFCLILVYWLILAVGLSTDNYVSPLTLNGLTWIFPRLTNIFSSLLAFFGSILPHTSPTDNILVIKCLMLWLTSILEFRLPWSNWTYTNSTKKVKTTRLALWLFVDIHGSLGILISVKNVVSK